MTEFGIDTLGRQAAFLAQVAHESGSLRYVREIADGNAYEGRADLGNTSPGDGPRFKGRGLIQITGRANYRACSRELYGDDDALLLHPELLEDVVPACRSAAWFWWSHGLNSIADLGDYRKITRVINGGFNGYGERLAYFQRAQAVLV
jgi:putative chitinase